MSWQPLDSLLKTINEEVEDPRIDRTKRYRLGDLIVMAVLACICGANGWHDIAAFCALRKSWLVQLFGLEVGRVPCADTFARTLSRIDASELQRAFVQWTLQAVGTDESGHIAIDGKAMRRSGSQSQGKPVTHLVSAWATELGLVLAQRAVDAKENEIVAIPELLKVLKLSGATITIDAIGCQREIASQIRKRKGDYILQVKGNQPTLLNEIQSLFESVDSTPAHHVDRLQRNTHESVDADHGRVETRQVTATGDITWLQRENRWSGIASVLRVERKREVGAKASHETSYYISSLPPNAEHQGKLIREHWHIENRLHWVLDMAFREDELRIRNGTGPENISMLYKVTLALLRLEKTSKYGLQIKRKQAGWSNEYLLTVLGAVAQAHR